MRTVADFHGKSQNLGFAKWLCAVLVIFSHAYGVFGRGSDPLERLSGGQLSFGGLAVALFLFASGFFVTKSLMNRNGKQFFRSRFLRLWPAFAAVILLSGFLLGPLTTALPAGSYFASAQTWQYLLFLLLIPRYQLPGVFMDHPLTHVNASLWTMLLGALCYLALFLAWKLKLLQKRFTVWYLGAYVLCAAVVFGLQPAAIAVYSSYLRPVFFFAAGILFRLNRDRIPLNLKTGLISGGLFVLLFALGRANLAMVLCFPWLLALMTFSSRQLPALAGRTGDYSYALYLCAFPLQQLWYSWFPQSGIALHVLLVTASSVLIVLPLHYGIEKRFS